jgi:hypothetical protein
MPGWLDLREGITLRIKTWDQNGEMPYYPVLTIGPPLAVICHS